MHSVTIAIVRLFAQAGSYREQSLPKPDKASAVYKRRPRVLGSGENSEISIRSARLGCPGKRKGCEANSGQGILAKKKKKEHTWERVQVRIPDEGSTFPPDDAFILSTLPLERLSQT